MPCGTKGERGLLRRRDGEKDADFELRVNRFNAVVYILLGCFAAVPLLVVEYLRNSQQLENHLAILSFITIGSLGSLSVVFGLYYAREDIRRTIVYLHTPPRLLLCAVVFTAAIVVVNIVRHEKGVRLWVQEVLFSLFGALTAYCVCVAPYHGRAILARAWPRHKLPTPALFLLGTLTCVAAAATVADLREARGVPSSLGLARALIWSFGGAAIALSALASASYARGLAEAPATGGGGHRPRPHARALCWAPVLLWIGVVALVCELVARDWCSNRLVGAPATCVPCNKARAVCHASVGAVLVCLWFVPVASMLA